ncbi:hypothetical protein HYALB_00008068 [Hymenoscyphus albidus]|uniref:Isochorismatase-like domain-containing protein n=1 Tax=Hymenoscyphus albidus TaxID=595503 RepID=A0A9N9Q4W9_9HELO|nr:hypothetical protein HYALB_00008068 [Hymenoscyphus albidus]
MAPITFGPAHRQWKYQPESKTYDVSGSETGEKLKIETSAGVQGTSVVLDPGKTAFVIVDMQNYFLDGRCMDHPNGIAAIEPTIKVLDGCRKTGVQVVWLNWGLTDLDLESMPAGIQRGFMKDTLLASTSQIRPWVGLGSELPDDQGRVLFKGSWNADIYPRLKVHIQEEDVHCAKNRMSGLWRDYLKDAGKETILFAGVNTDQCVLGALTDAYNNGWNCVLINDCCGTTTKGAREVVVGNVGDHYGFVIDSKGFAAAGSGKAG